MNVSQERLVNYVRGLHRRDRIGPEAFPIRTLAASPKTTPGTGTHIDWNLPGLKGVSDLTTHKQHEAFRRGLVLDTSIVTPKSPPAALIKQISIPSITEAAAQSLDKVIHNKPLSQKDLAHLESIIIPALRPAFDILNESYEDLPDYWSVLNHQRKAMEPIIRGVGRLQLTGHPSYTLVGTGFVCGPNRILTNYHVAQIFVRGVESGGQLSYLPGVTCAMDMLAEVGNANSLRLDVTRPLTISSRWDAALLHVESLPGSIEPLPLAKLAPSTLDGGFAAIIGYPSYDPYESFVDQANIFRAVFDRKRLQPGKLNGRADVDSFGHTVSAVAHDCSTLGGNSGSVLVAVDDPRVVGLHFSGVTHVSNYAVPTWELLNDPAFAGQALNFV
ncbi:MAG: trypsin-like serine peptidase [Verrucomicrobiia bacterium]